MPAVKEPVSLMLDDSKQSDGTDGQERDSTGHVCRVAHCQHADHVKCGSQQSSTEERRRVYIKPSSTHLFYPLAVETAGVRHEKATELRKGQMHNYRHKR